jgi:cysteine desulfurase
MILKNSIYLDNAHATKPFGLSVSKMTPFYQEKWGVFAQPHEAGQELEKAIKNSYQQLYSSLKADPEDLIIFCSSGAEAVNQVILNAYFDLTLSTGKNHFMVGKSDEAPAIMSINRLEKIGAVGSMVTVDKQSIIDAITPRTAFISLSLGNGLTGTLVEMAEILPILKERGIKIHLDISHAFGKLSLDLHELGADYITLDGGLVHAPKSSGLLWVKKGEKMAPFITGGLDQGGHRGAPLDVATLVGFSDALREAHEATDFMSTEIARLKGEFEKGLKAIGGKVLFDQTHRLPHITAVSFENVANEALLFRLNRDNCYASIGGGNLQEIGLVVKALGLKEEEGLTAISFALSRETTEDEIDRALILIEKNVKEIKKLTAAL